MGLVGIFKWGLSQKGRWSKIDWKASANFIKKFVIKFAFFLTYILYSDFITKYFRMYKNATAYYINNK